MTDHLPVARGIWAAVEPIADELRGVLNSGQRKGGQV